MLLFRLILCLLLFSQDLRGEVHGQSYFEDVDDEEIQLFSRQPAEVDAYGVERSPKLFMRRPELDLRIKRDLFWRDKSTSRLEKAVAMLEDDFKTNDLLREAWEMGHRENADYASDPLKMAAYIYSMSEHNQLYKHFNEAIAKFKSGSSYDDFNFKGLYALLLLSVHQYEHDLYRGVGTLMPAEKDMHVRFNRFSSSTTNLTTAMIYATKRGGLGTLLIFKGRKNAAHIDPYSYFPDEDEYLIEPDNQFRVVEVVDSPAAGEMNPGRRIVLTRAYYPWPSFLPFF